MKWTVLGTIAISALILWSLPQGHSPAKLPGRGPAGAASASFQAELERLYDSGLKIRLLKEKRERAGQSADLEAQVAQFNELKSRIESSLRGNGKLRNPGPLSIEGETSLPWRTHEDSLVIDDPSLYALESGKVVRTYAMSDENTASYRLFLGQEVFSKDMSQDQLSRASERGIPLYLRASVSCDGPFTIRRNLGPDLASDGRATAVRIYDRKINGARAWLVPGGNVRSCELRFMRSGETTQYGVRLVSEREQLKDLISLTRKVDFCLLPKTDRLSPIQAFFLNSGTDQMTCPNSVDSVRTLENPYDGISAKVEMLLGQPLPREVFDRQDPFVELDFSKAPKLDAIFISYLVFRSDFYGNLMARLLEHHAKRGTAVRIIASSVIQLDKDNRMLAALTARNGNIKYLSYRYDTSGGKGNLIDEFHRTMHMKLLITLSESDPQANAVVIGGRNIHDGFLFQEAPDHSRYPSLVNYPHDENFVHWRDFEVQIKDPAFARKIAAHYLTLYQQDSDSFFVRDLNLNLRAPWHASEDYFTNADSKPLVRHLVSVPYKDDGRLENLFATMIDSATRKIQLSTPYFRPTPKISAALERAVSRGVDVTLLTRINLDGDTADFILSDVNKEGVNQFLRKIRIYEYTEPKVILHSKLVLIDDQFTFLGGVNLNKRSFIHDAENAALVYSPAFNQKVERVYRSYFVHAREITDEMKVKFWKKLLIRLVDEEF